MTTPSPTSATAPDWLGGRGSLQRRLLLRTLVVVALTAVLLGALTAVGARQLLVGQIDSQLVATVDRVPRGQSPRGGDGPPQGVNLPGQPLGTVVLLSDGRRAVAGIQTEDGAVYLPTDTATPLLDVVPGKPPRSLTLPGLGHYRVVADRVGSNGLLVVGLPLAGVEETLTRLLVLEGLLTALLLAAAGVGVRTVVVRGLRPLNRLALTAQQVSALELGSGEVELAVRVPPTETDPANEVGRVGLAFNHMLDHVGGALAARQASETKLRRFVADASHELRNPLAAIRGYAELTRRSREAVPPDTVFALGRIESEAGRMTRLVEDLLLLARLDSAPRLRTGDVDVSDLLVNAVSDARAAGPDHRWTMRLPEEAVVVRGDAFQLSQVLTNLLANARTHTPPGTVVTAEVDVEPAGAGPAGAGPADVGPAGGDGRPGWVVLSVSDDGPGIPADSQAHVFERFARADESRTRVGGRDDRPSGTGLGLAIVAAVVAAHHGRVDLSSQPGETIFTVRLPLASPTP